MQCIFVTDLHGKVSRYEKLFQIIRNDLPDIVLFGGDLLPHGIIRIADYDHFTTDFLFPQLQTLKSDLNGKFPKVLMILGNDDPRSEEKHFQQYSDEGLIHYIHSSSFYISGWTFFGYSYIPPTPFQIKDWEKYDVSRFADPGCIHPTEGFRTIEPPYDTEYSTIQKDLVELINEKDLTKSVFLFHAPPYKSNLDRAALDGQMIDHVPLDVHVGSIAIQRFIKDKKPPITLHGHVHESTRMTGSWKEQIGDTWSFNAAHDGQELSYIVFDPEHPQEARRMLV